MWIPPLVMEKRKFSLLINPHLEGMPQGFRGILLFCLSLMTYSLLSKVGKDLGLNCRKYLLATVCLV